MHLPFARELPLCFVCLCLTATTFAAPATRQARSDGLHIPLSRQVRRDRTPEEWAQWAEREKAKLETKYSGSASRKRSSGYNLLVNQNADSSYYGSIAVGTPATAYNVVLDTGSSDLWLTSSSCSSGCPSGIQAYDSSSSSTFSDVSSSFSVTYGSGFVSGSLVSDVVQMAGFQVSDQIFGLADETSSDLIDEPVSGLLGLAWQGLSTSGAKPFWQQLYESNVLDEPVMGFQLTRYLNVSQAETLEYGGTFTLGALNTSLYTGDVDYIDLSQDNLYWTINLANITVGATTLSVTSDNAAVIDTGTTLIGGPSSAVANVYAQISGSEALSGNYDGYYSYPCDTDVDISMSFGGRTWSISSADFTLTELSSGACVGSLFVYGDDSSSSGPSGPPSSPFKARDSSSVSWIIGDTFLKNVYSVFRASPASVGFADLSAEALAQNGHVDSSVPTPTIGAVSASVTGSRAASGALRPKVRALVLAAVFFVQLLI